MMQTVIVTESFAAAHRYAQPKWAETENQNRFGKCFSAYGHGHNYRLEVAFQEPLQPLETLRLHVQKVTHLLDHQHLNFAVPYFKDAIPTTENIALFLLKKLQELCPKEAICSIRLYEMDNLWVEIRT